MVDTCFSDVNTFVLTPREAGTRFSYHRDGVIGNCMHTLRMRTIFLALQLAAGQEAISQPARVNDEAAIRARVAQAVQTFHLIWRGSWQKTQDERRPATANDPYFQKPTDTRRGNALHCHWDLLRPEVRDHIIQQTFRAQAVCPLWYPLDEPVEDERRGIDFALIPDLRPVVDQFRFRLRTVLDSAAAELPGDAMLAEQRVRFALDAGDAAGAAIAAMACTGDRARCGLLHGYLLYRVGFVADADSAFAAAIRFMNDDARCRWSDVSPLLDRRARREYESMSCQARADAESRLWWLSDPLYVEPGNERRAEHYARKVEVAIRIAFERDERQRWDKRFGGEAVAEMIIRYGWPAHVYWGGTQVDIGHDGWLIERHAELAAPYVVPEYTRGRLHTVPKQSALAAPLTAKAEDWQLNAPRDDNDWWPVEHYARGASRIVEFPDGQRGMLRRRDHARLVWALDLDTAALSRSTGDSLRASVFMSSSPVDMVRAGEFAATVGSPLRIDAALRASAALLGLEVPGDTARPAARTRFGLVIAEPLSALGSARAVSQPLLYDPPEESPLTLTADSAVRRLYPTTSFAGVKRLGVYWEAYGFAASDTVDTQVRISREDRKGIFARVASVLGVGTTEGGSITLRWQETQRNTRAIQAAEGSVPVQMRSIALEISQLPSGNYTLSVSAGAPGAIAVTSARTFVIR